MITGVPVRRRTQVVQDDIGRLMDFDAGRVRSITVYANTRRESGGMRDVTNGVTRALEAVEQSVADSPERHEAFVASRDLVGQALDDPLMFTGMGLALFACAPRRFLEAYTLNTPLPNRVVFARRLYIPPLGQLTETFDTHVIAQVHSDRASLYTAYLHRLWPCVEIASDVPGRTAVGGWSQARYQRHREEHVRRHLRRVADEITSLMADESADRLLLFGSSEAVESLHRILPAAIQQRVLCQEAMAADADEPELRERTKDLIHAYRDRQAESAIEELRARLATDGRAVAGVDGVLEALWRRAVDAVVLTRGVRASVTVCPACGWMSADRSDSCLSCSAVTETGNLGARVARAARAQGASVLFIEDPEVLDPLGGVAAFVRY